MFRRVFTAANAILWAHLIVRFGALFLVPLYLKYWSAGLYGEYLALFAAVSYFTSLDIGMQQAAINRLTQAHARGDFAEYRSVLDTAMAFYLLLAAGVTCLVAGIAHLPLDRSKADESHNSAGSADIAGRIHGVVHAHAAHQCHLPNNGQYGTLA